MRKPTILIVDDEPAIADTMEFALITEGFDVLRCELGEQALNLVKCNPTIALVVLDVGLPDINGFEVCKNLREFSDTPVLFLTARNAELDRIVGLEIGADDYVVKPFSPREVATRVKVILKRLGASAPKQEKKSEEVLFIDHEKAQVIFKNTELGLTRYEYLLLISLAEFPERVLSRTQLMDKVWPDCSGSMERSVDTHIKTLRAKLREVDPDCEVIKTHRGLGYSLVAL